MLGETLDGKFPHAMEPDTSLVGRFVDVPSGVYCFGKYWVCYVATITFEGEWRANPPPQTPPRRFSIGSRRIHYLREKIKTHGLRTSRPTLVYRRKDPRNIQNTIRNE